jgi:VIT1/CCC1 family predicted Fe2+/Mn2+ transporter
VAAFRGVIAGTPGAFAAIRAEITPQNPMAEARPMAHALWMFISNLFAGAVPVVPFALLPFQEAHLVNHRHHCALAGARRRT